MHSKPRNYGKFATSNPSSNKNTRAHECYTGTMAVSISLEDLESTIAMVDTVLQHLKNQGKASKQDIAQLKEIIFHLDW